MDAGGRTQEHRDIDRGVGLWTTAGEGRRSSAGPSARNVRERWDRAGVAELRRGIADRDLNTQCMGQVSVHDELSFRVATARAGASGRRSVARDRNQSRLLPIGRGKVKTRPHSSSCAARLPRVDEAKVFAVLANPEPHDAIGCIDTNRSMGVADAHGPEPPDGLKLKGGMLGITFSSSTFGGHPLNVFSEPVPEPQNRWDDRWLKALSTRRERFLRELRLRDHRVHRSRRRALICRSHALRSCSRNQSRNRANFSGASSALRARSIQPWSSHLRMKDASSDIPPHNGKGSIRRPRRAICEASAWCGNRTAREPGT